MTNHLVSHSWQREMHLVAFVLLRKGSVVWLPRHNESNHTLMPPPHTHTHTHTRTPDNKSLSHAHTHRHTLTPAHLLFKWSFLSFIFFLFFLTLWETGHIHSFLAWHYGEHICAGTLQALVVNAGTFAFTCMLTSSQPLHSPVVAAG